MQSPDLDRVAALRKRVRIVIADLRDLGFTTNQMRRKSIIELEEMRAQAYVELMKAPTTDKAG
jgi:hypothetical protein